jgi:hypothetical protein
MDIYSARFRLGSEHKEFVKDVTNVIISYTPLSGVRDTIKFGQKWISEKRMADRVARYIERNDRKSFIKSRGRRIRESLIRPYPEPGRTAL